MFLKRQIKRLPILNKYFRINTMYIYYKRQFPSEKRINYIKKHITKAKIYSAKGDKLKKICSLIRDVDLYPVENNLFFYSIDPFKNIDHENPLIENYTIDYSLVINHSLMELIEICGRESEFVDSCRTIIGLLKTYVSRLSANTNIYNKYRQSIKFIEDMFCNRAEHFVEALQRILFINQWLWQTGHRHNGLGHLDWMLIDLYNADIQNGIITEKMVEGYLKDFFACLHDKYWFKSSMLLGDTGQIIILGGVYENIYKCNELTFLFIRIAQSLRLPDPKILLRVSKTMPIDLMNISLDCISTGIGAPLLSNDDVIIPLLKDFGYDEYYAFNYVTSACWEPLIPGDSCDQNNMGTINFVKPFVSFLNSKECADSTSIDEFKSGYFKYLIQYVNEYVGKFDDIEFEKDPFISIFSHSSLVSNCDITKGGAVYSNIGFTTVGLSNVVNSILNVNKYVFTRKDYTISSINDIRRKNYDGYSELMKRLYKESYCFGKDGPEIINLTNEIFSCASNELNKHKTIYGGKYKLGLSSPNYIIDASKTEATLDGRQAGRPFGVHVSGKNGISPVELISFSTQISYSDNRFNGNVVDLILTPSFINQDRNRAISLIMGAINMGLFQIQVNVVDSKTLLEAQLHPDKFPNLVVRVWGFSAYFVDLPKEYQDNLIIRTQEAETTVS